MYKDLKKHMQKNKTPKKTYSSDQVVRMVRERLLEKSQSYPECSEEELEKNIKNAFKTGLSVLGLIHGAHYFDKPDTQQPAPRSIERTIAAKPDPKVNMRPTVEGSYKDKSIKNFLKAISMNETSGGKDMDHKTMKHGIHAGDTAHGLYGLMPNTVKETVNRMGRGHPLHRKYANMPNEKIGDSLSANPDHEQEIATHMANRLHAKHGGDESKMAYSWLNGTNLTDKHFASNHSGYADHDYVQKYHKHRQQIEKSPQKPE